MIKAILKTEIKKIEKPSEKDIKNGLRYSFVVEEQIKKVFQEQEFIEVLIYQIKTQDDLKFELGDQLLIQGKMWEVKPDDRDYKIRGFTNPQVFKISGADYE